MQLVQYPADPREATAERVDDARHSVNTALTTIGLCIDFLAEHSSKAGRDAAEDARAAVRRISSVMVSLRGDLQSQVVRGELGTAAVDRSTSGVFRRSDPPAAGDTEMRDETG
jgi:hypothetical protein